MFHQLLTPVGASLTFFSNLFFYLKSGYFDVGSETKPLLHTCACMGHEVPIWECSSVPPGNPPWLAWRWRW